MFDHVTDLASVFGATPGDDRVLIDWDEMSSWLEHICHLSPHLSLQELGTSTEGRPMSMVVASSPETLGQLDTIIAARSELKRTANFSEDASTAGAKAGTTPVILITAGIHATEVGGVQMMPGFIRDLTTESPYHELLERVILLIVPTLNPDGMDLVHNWYQKTLGTNAEGSYPPAPYHKYAGHDNNRDWYQRHLQETRVVLDEVHRVWIPHVVIDLHQMGQKSPRYVVPPYIDPAEHAVHPLVYPLAAELGSKIATDQARAGYRGVSSGVMFDCYSPTRAYMHYHGGVRILAEAASAGIASPVHVSEHELNLFWDAPSQFASVHMPLPWRGGTWHLGDIIRLHRQTIDSVVQHVAADPQRWLEDQWKMLWDQVNLTNFGTLFISPLKYQYDPAAARELIDLLLAGDIEMYVTEEDDELISAHTFVIPVQQPFGSYASALLALALYPPGQQAYDVTSHCLPIHMGVDVQYYDYAYSGPMHVPTEQDLQPFRPAQAEDIRPDAWLAIDPRSSSAVRLVNHALRTSSEVRRLEKPQLSGQRLLDPGTWIIADSSVWDVMSHAAKMHVRTTAISPVAGALPSVRQPKLGLYDPQHQSASDFGWLRLWLERAGFEFEILTSEDIVHGRIQDIETLLVPHTNPELLIWPHPEHAYPPEFSRGLSDRVSVALRTWLHHGGHLIAFEGAVSALTDRLNIPLVQPRIGTHKKSFASSGAIVSLKPNTHAEASLGIDEPFPAMYFTPYAYELGDTGSQVSLAAFTGTPTVISGRMKGEKHLAGLHAAVQMSQGDGRFTAFAYRPHFRTQMLASERLLVNVLLQQ